MMQRGAARLRDAIQAEDAIRHAAIQAARPSRPAPPPKAPARPWRSSRVPSARSFRLRHGLFVYAGHRRAGRVRPGAAGGRAPAGAGALSRSHQFNPARDNPGSRPPPRARRGGGDLRCPGGQLLSDGRPSPHARPRPLGVVRIRRLPAPCRLVAPPRSAGSPAMRPAPPAQKRPSPHAQPADPSAHRSLRRSRTTTSSIPRPRLSCVAHLACFAAIWTGVTVEALALGVALYVVRMFGVTAGYHRYFSHRAFKTSRAVPVRAGVPGAELGAARACCGGRPSIAGTIALRHRARRPLAAPARLLLRARRLDLHRAAR